MCFRHNGSGTLFPGAGADCDDPGVGERFPAQGWAICENFPQGGYSWFFRTDTGKPGPQPKTGLPVELAGERLLPAESDLVGAPQTREVMIKAVRPGKIYVVGNCIRAWEKGAKPEISVRYRFTVVY